MPIMPNTCLNNIPSVVQTFDHEDSFARRCIKANGPLIVGAGPSGLAVGAGLKKQGVPFIILERANYCIASLRQNHTYYLLKLHLPKQFCQLPYFPFPEDFPEYPTKSQFITYLESYAKHFDISPNFNETVQSAKYDETFGLWRVKTIRETSSNSNLIGDDQVEYICRWLVVATGENAEKVVPEFEGFEEFGGRVIHVCDYKSGMSYGGKRVLVVGCGNSGMEVSLDLCNHEAEPSMVVRNSVHVLPREVMEKSTFELAVLLMKWLPLWLVDKMLLILAWLILGNVEKYGLRRPSIGPLQLKNSAGKTPVLDIGALQKIRSGEIKVVPGVKRFFLGRVELVNGDDIEIDSVILATGYRSNIPSWLKARTLFWVLVILILLHIVQTRPLVPYGKDTHAVKLWVSIGSSYRPHLKVYELFQRLIASTEEQLRVFALEIEDSDGGEEGVSIKQEYQRSQETSTSRCQEEHMLHFRVNKGVSDRNEGGGEEGEGRNGGRGNGSGRRGGGGRGGDGDGDKDDVESKGGDKKKYHYQWQCRPSLAQHKYLVRLYP